MTVATDLLNRASTTLVLQTNFLQQSLGVWSMPGSGFLHLHVYLEQQIMHVYWEQQNMQAMSIALHITQKKRKTGRSCFDEEQEWRAWLCGCCTSL